MPDAPPLESFTAGVETSVDVGGIERQLRELWQMAAASEQDPSRRAITRACRLNLVAYAETEEARDHAADTISLLTSTHPCRAIVLLARPEKDPSELSASITAHCHLAGGGKQVCCEQISMRAAGDGVSHLAGAVLPLLESDLPTILWWQGNFLERPELFSRIGAVSDRVIFDSSGWTGMADPLPPLSRLVRAENRRRFFDLSWTRLRLWRELTADLFDDAECRCELDRIGSVAIDHGCGPGGRLRGRLLAGWLAAQLEWTPARARDLIRLRCLDDPDATAVGIIRIEIKTASATFTVQKNHGEFTASATVTMPRACGLPRTRAFGPSDDASLLAEELDRTGSHTVYGRALELAAEL